MTTRYSVLLSLGARFMEPFWVPEIPNVRVPLDEPGLTDVLTHWRGRGFAYAMNAHPPDRRIQEAAAVARDLGIPTVWHTIEDPNHFDGYKAQAAGFDVICTTARELLPRYAALYPAATVVWLPLAAQPQLHLAYPPNHDAVDFILAANWYAIPERLEAVRTVVDPIVEGAHHGRWTFALYAYEAAEWPAWIRHFRRGASSCYNTARVYREGRVVLAVNNQARATTMTSMRTFEALCCAKPMLASWSDAYKALGFLCDDWSGSGSHFISVDSTGQATVAAEWLLANPAKAAAMGKRGRRFVLEHHTYRHRLAAILEALGSRISPLPPSAP